MIRNLKILGLALVAVLALSAMVASAASAANYTAQSYPTTGTGESALGNDTFTTEAGTVECKAHFEATLTEAKPDLTVKAKYENCKAFGFATATVNMGSCDYTFTTPVFLGTHVSTNTHTWTVPINLHCTDSTKPITITAGNCELTVGAQTPDGHVIITVTTNAKPRDVHVQATFTNIKYTVVKDGFLCPFSGVGAKEGATYTQHKEITFASTNGQDIDIG